MARIRTWLATLGVAGLLALAVACGGDDNGGGSGQVSESQAKETADRFLLNLFGVLTGDTNPRDFIGQFAPECRENVNEDEIVATLELVQSLGAGFTDLDFDIEEFDIGDVNVEQTDEGTLVSPKNTEDIRVKVDGKFVNANDYLQSVGFEDFGTDDASEDPILMVRRDGKTYIGDCSFLADFSIEG